MKNAAVIVACLIPFASFAWDEPDNVFGIKLGAEISNIGLPACPTSQDSKKEAPKFCILDEGFPNQRSLYSVPDIGISYSARLHIYDNRIADVTLRFTSDDYPKVIQLLIERYGSPTDKDVTAVKPKWGDMFYSPRAMWKGKKVTVIAMEKFPSSNSVNASLDTEVRFVSVDVYRKFELDGNQKIKDGARKL